MEQRCLGSTGRSVSAVGLGTWQLGADWGEVDEDQALEVLRTSAEAGVTFFDTADVYGDGRSEQLLGRFLAGTRAALRSRLTVATKMGRRLPQEPASYTLDNFRAWTERSRRNLGVDTLDLVQLHCPPSEVIDAEQTYADLRTLVEEGAIAAYGVSVETCDQAVSAIEHGAATVQIIVNAFRLKPLERVLPLAVERGVGIIVRVPLASGLLSGRYTSETTFAPDDHRSYNRQGEAFDVGETFSGVDFETGVRAAQEFGELARRVAPHATPAQVAIAWVSRLRGVSTVIPGARSAEQARANAAAGELPPLPADLDHGIHAIYERHLRASVHPRW